MDLNNAAAIVTGGASGLGEATARMLAARGAKVAIFDLNEELGEKIASELGGKFFKVDVANEENVISSVAAAQEAHGTARVLVNCAGVGTPTKVIDRDNNPLPLAQFTKVVNINLVGSFNVLTHFAAGLVHAEPGEDGARGVIINTASVAAYDGQIGQAAYSASKGGIVGMTLPIAREFARHGIRVMTIAPGIFWTPLLAGLPQAAQDSLATQVPFPSRLGQPSEYAQLCESIIDNPMLNGECIRLDGAIRMAPK